MGTADMAIEMATFGGGRFWVMEAVFQQIRGVKSTQSGYAGGCVNFPSYEQVCGGETGHAEVVRLRFDPFVVTYQSLLSVFLKIQDSDFQDRNKETFASPLRSAIYFHNDDQKKLANEMMERQLRLHGKAPSIELREIDSFFLAEDEHQNFYKNNREDPFCAEFIEPKIVLSRNVFKKKVVA